MKNYKMGGIRSSMGEMRHV